MKHYGRSTNIFRFAVLGGVLVLLSPVLFCVGTIMFAMLKPTTQEQVLQLAALPSDTILPLRSVGPFQRTDYRPVEDALRQQFPHGTTEDLINQVLLTRGQQCQRETEGIVCRFEHSNIACHMTVTVMFQLTSHQQLDQIRISSSDVCM